MFVVQFIIMTAGFSSLLKVSAEHLDGMVYSSDFSNYFVSYLLCYGLGIASLIYNKVRKEDGKRDRYTRNAVYVFALLFALMITCANYALLFLPTPEYAGRLFRNIYRCAYVVTVFAGSACAAYNFLYCMSGLSFLWKKRETDRKPAAVFLTAFALIFLVDFLILMLCKYPGNIFTDSFSQIYQATGDLEYSNHHPFYHTMVIRLFLNIGMALFGKYNAAVALYSCFQILFMAACFAYGVLFLYELGAPRPVVIGVTAVYAFAPYHIMYSFSMTKDTMFSGFVLVAVISFFRYVKRMGNNAVNLAVVIVSGMGVCLFRSNGLFVYVLWIICIVCLFGRSTGSKPGVRRLLICMAATALISFGMKGPMLKLWNVSSTDFIESLSIPLQQIARTLVDNDDLTDEQTGLLSEVMSVDKIRESYSHYSSDPLKERIRAEGNEPFLVEHKADFLKLYLSIGIKHPGSYLAGWIDQTYGFWNAGYKDWHWYDRVGSKIFDNRYDIHRTVISEGLNNAFNEYCWLFEELPVLQLFLCMGLHMWIGLVILFMALVKKNKEEIMITLPILLILLSLVIATPLSMEFRYFYAAFCVLPVTVPVIFGNDVSGVFRKQ